MPLELAKTYDAETVERAIWSLWEQREAFRAVPDPTGQTQPFVIVIPPPNVTAALHMGHALNNTLQDILTRWRRMCGDNAVWIPGTDHAGIATQTVVEKRVMQEEGKRRTDFERDAFVEKIQAWKDEYERRITEQLKAMGCSCDWSRQAFTMDEPRARAVREAFFRLFQDGLIYRGKRLVNWDPVTQTALADDEVESRDIDGHFWYMKYPVVDEQGDDTGEFVTVATTRPETMLGDTAVAVNPNDPQRAAFIGRHVRLPIVNRIIPVIGDDYVVIPHADAETGPPVEASGTDVKAKYASGFLKVTPAHDPNDYEIGQRHGLPIINVMAPDGSISREHGWSDWDQTPRDPFCEHLQGMDRYEAREAIVDWFRTQNLLAEVRPYTHAVGHSYRSHVPIEPYLSDQWYVKVTDDRLAGAALDAMAEGQRSVNDGCAWTDEHPFHKAATAGRGPVPTPVPTPVPGSGTDVNSDDAGDTAGPRPPVAALCFHPARYARTFQHWHENIRDWCISRQLWWGHRIPVWRYEFSAAAAELLRSPPSDGKFFEALPDIDERALRRWGELPQESPTKVAHQGFRSVPHPDPVAGLERVKSDMRRRGLPERFIDGIHIGAQELALYLCVDERSPEIVGEIEALGYVRDPDVLDTWFSSGLWPLSTLGWPDETDELKAWNPTSVLCTAREIITLWVSRMVMFNRYFRDGDLPFGDVFIHAMIQDGQGQKMSKSLGNGVDPLDIIHSHGADAMRYTLAAMTTQTQDVRMPVEIVCPHCEHAFEPKTITLPAGQVVAAPTQKCPQCKKKMASSFGVASGQASPSDEAPAARNTSSKFDGGRNFANKIWNAGRFALGHLEASPRVAPGATPTSLADRWILSRLARTVASVDEALGAYQFNVYAQALYDFFWRDLCDWYLESIKGIVREASDEGAAARATLATCLDAALRMLHPVMPFVTEQLWQALSDVAPQRGVAQIASPPSELCMTASWPAVDVALIDDEAEGGFDLLREVIGAVRNVRSEYNVPPRKTVTMRIKATGSAATTLESSQGLIEALAMTQVQAIGAAVTVSESAATAVVGSIELYLDDLIDVDAERQRLAKRVEELRGDIASRESRLGNPGYVEKAPPHLVQQTRDELEAMQQERAAIEAKLRDLGER